MSETIFILGEEYPDYISLVVLMEVLKDVELLSSDNGPAMLAIDSVKNRVEMLFNNKTEKEFAERIKNE